MSLLTIAQDAANEIGLDLTPTTIIGNNDPDAQRLLRFATRVCRELNERAPWQRLRFDAAFLTQASVVQTGVITPDFSRFIPETMRNRDTGMYIGGPLPPVEWQNKIGSVAYPVPPTGAPQWWTRQGDFVSIWPAPPAGQYVSYTYQSRAFCRSVGGTLQTAWLADTDVALLDEEMITLGVIAGFLAADGQPLAAAANIRFERRVATMWQNDQPTGEVLAAGDLFAPWSARRGTGEPVDMSLLGPINSPWTWDNINLTWVSNPTYWTNSP